MCFPYEPERVDEAGVHFDQVVARILTGFPALVAYLRDQLDWPNCTACIPFRRAV